MRSTRRCAWDSWHLDICCVETPSHSKVFGPYCDLRRIKTSQISQNKTRVSRLPAVKDLSYTLWNMSRIHFILLHCAFKFSAPPLFFCHLSSRNFPGVFLQDCGMPTGWSMSPVRDYLQNIGSMSSSVCACSDTKTHKTLKKSWLSTQWIHIMCIGVYLYFLTLYYIVYFYLFL